MGTGREFWFYYIFHRICGSCSPSLVTLLLDESNGERACINNKEKKQILLNFLLGYGLLVFNISLLPWKQPGSIIFAKLLWENLVFFSCNRYIWDKLNTY